MRDLDETDLEILQLLVSNSRRPYSDIAAISIGAAIEGILFDVGGFTFHDAGKVGTAFVALGMLSVLYALYGRDSRTIRG